MEGFGQGGNDGVDDRCIEQGAHDAQQAGWSSDDKAGKFMLSEGFVEGVCHILHEAGRGLPMRWIAVMAADLVGIRYGGREFAQGREGTVRPAAHENRGMLTGDHHNPRDCNGMCHAAIVGATGIKMLFAENRA